MVNSLQQIAIDYTPMEDEVKMDALRCVTNVGCRTASRTWSSRKRAVCAATCPKPISSNALGSSFFIFSPTAVAASSSSRPSTLNFTTTLPAEILSMMTVAPAHAAGTMPRVEGPAPSALPLPLSLLLPIEFVFVVAVMVEPTEVTR